MQPLYWVVSGILVLAHGLFSPIFGTDSGWTWALAIVMLTVVIRTALIPLFVKQIKSSRSMQLLQPKVRELQKKYGHDREKLGRRDHEALQGQQRQPAVVLPAAAAADADLPGPVPGAGRRLPDQRRRRAVGPRATG